MSNTNAPLRLHHPLDRTFPWVAWGLMLFYIVLVFWLYRDYGNTWDEYVQVEYGYHFVNYYWTGFEDRKIVNLAITGPEYLYGGATFSLAPFVQTIFGGEVYTISHLINGLLGLIGLFYAFLLGRHLTGSKWAGLVCASFLFFTPRFFGHVFNNTKDMPFACFYLASIYHLMRAVESWPRPLARRDILALALSMGFLMGIRVAGLIAVCYYVFFYLLYHWSHRHQDDFPSLGETLYRGIRNVLVPILIAYLIMLFFWPWAQQAPLTRPLEALQTFSTKMPLVKEFPFRGETHNVYSVSRAYIPVWFAISTPLYILVGGVIFFAFLPFRIAREGDGETKQKWSEGVVFFAFAFPIAYALYKKPPHHDGIRHYLFVLALLAVMSGVGYHSLLQWVKGRGWVGKKHLPSVLVGLGMLFWGPIGHWYITFHPYQYVYFNQPFGGVAAAVGNYEVDYWGSSYRMAAEWLNKNHHQLDGKDDGTIKLAFAGHPITFYPFLNKKLFHCVQDSDDWDYYIATSSYFQFREGYFQDRPISAVKVFYVDQVPMVFVYKALRR